MDGGADILARIEVYKRQEIAAARLIEDGADWRARAEAMPPARDFAGALRAKIDGRPARADRGDQEGEPVEGPHPRRLRPARARPCLRRRRRRLPLRPHRRPVLPGRTGVPDRRPRSRHAACAAQGLHVRSGAGVPGARVGGRRDPRHHDRGRRCGRRRARRHRQRLRHGGAPRGARRARPRACAPPAVRAHRHQQPRPQDLPHRPRRHRAPRARWCRRTGS